MRRSPSPPKADVKRWGVLWRLRTTREGYQQHFMWSDDSASPKLFCTRSQARAWIKDRFGYLADREDLKAEPHGWMMPKAVRVRVSITLEAKP